MFEFDHEIECANHWIGNLELAVDATLIAADDFDLNNVYLFIGAVGSVHGDAAKRYIQSTDLTIVKVRGNKVVTSYWRAVPESDPFYAEIIAAVEGHRAEILSHLHNEEAAA